MTRSESASLHTDTQTPFVCGSHPSDAMGEMTQSIIHMRSSRTYHKVVDNRGDGGVVADLERHQRVDGAEQRGLERVVGDQLGDDHAQHLARVPVSGGGKERGSVGEVWLVLANRGLIPRERFKGNGAEAG